MTKREELREDDGTAALDLAELELRNYETFQHSRKNLRAALTRMDTLSKKIDDTHYKCMANKVDVVKEKLDLRRLLLGNLRPTFRNFLNLETQVLKHLNFRVHMKDTASRLQTKLKQHNIPMNIKQTYVFRSLKRTEWTSNLGQGISYFNRNLNHVNKK